MQIIGYRIDLSKPYQIIDKDDTHVLVTGTSRVIQREDGEYGGMEGTWRIPKQMLLTKRQKRVIDTMRDEMGNRVAEQFRQKLITAVIAGHTNPCSE